MSSLLVGIGVARADNWPQWRGPDNNGISKEKNLPVEWDETKNVVWKLKMPGMAGSTPAVWGDRIFLTSEDGKEIWKADIQSRYGAFKPMHGMHTTPLLHGDRLYLQLIHANAAKVVALDKSNGDEVWKIERKSDGTDECRDSYASPSIGKNGKDEYLLVHGCDYTTAHSLKDGSEIWRVGDLNSKDHHNGTFRFVASPVATPELIVVPTCKTGGVVGVKPDASGTFGAGGSGEQWRLKSGTPDVPSPLVVDGLVYLCGDGKVTCLDAKTGKQYYSEQTRTGIHRASPVYADGKIYVAAENGTILVVKAGTKFELLAKNKLPDTITASPVVAGGRIYIRGWDNLYAISQDGK